MNPLLNIIFLYSIKSSKLINDYHTTWYVAYNGYLYKRGVPLFMNYRLLANRLKNPQLYIDNDDIWNLCGYGYQVAKLSRNYVSCGLK